MIGVTFDSFEINIDNLPVFGCEIDVNIVCDFYTIDEDGVNIHDVTIYTGDNYKMVSDALISGVLDAAESIINEEIHKATPRLKQEAENNE